MVSCSAWTRSSSRSTLSSVHGAPAAPPGTPPSEGPLQAAGTLAEDADPPHAHAEAGPAWYAGLAFQVPDFSVPLDVDQVTSQVPESARIKGFFIEGMERMVLPQLS